MILVYGRNKKGKTRFCISPGQGTVLVVDPEHGTDLYTKEDPHTWHVTRWEDFDQIYQFLRSGAHNYDWVALDGLTRMSNMALRFVMSQAEEHDLSRKPGMVQQRDYGKAGELVKGMLYNFRNIGIGVIITAQERQESNDFTEEDDDVESVAVQYVPDLPKGVRSAVNSIVDVIGRIYTLRVDHPTQEGKTITRHRLWLAPSGQFDTGFRSDYQLPDYLPNPTVPRLVKLIQNGPAALASGKKGK